jgi:Domain of unknown function (DUF4136)
MKTLKASLALLVVTAAACSSLQVTSDWDHTADFSKYKTFAIREGTKISDSLIEQRIERGIVSQLEAKGLRMDPNNPDLLVYTHVRVSNQTQIDYNTFGYGGYYGWGGWRTGGWGPTTATVREIPVGTLIVDLVDAGKKALVWRGTATDTISSDPNSRSQEKVDQALAKVFATFPPAPGK